MKMKKIWIISDTHFNHPDIVNKFEFRPIDYQEQIIRKIKKNVSDNDILIHLWDVIFDRQSELWDILKWMWNCTKILVRWNHDKKSMNFYLENWFDFVCDEYKIKGFSWYDIVFSHIPKTDDQLEEWFINIHWHLHSNLHRDISKYTKNPKNYLLYSAENENFMPIILNNILKRIKK